MLSLFKKEYLPLREDRSEEESSFQNLYRPIYSSHRFLARGLITALAILVFTNVFLLYRGKQAQPDDICISEYGTFHSDPYGTMRANLNWLQLNYRVIFPYLSP